MREIETSVGPVRVRELGPADGPVAVFVHGVLVDSRLWDPVAERLVARGVRCVLPDLPLGSHRLPMRAGADRSPRGVARAVGELLDALDVREATLVGNDTGGALCQFLLDAGSGRIARVVLTNCDAFDTFPPFPFDVIFGLFKSAAVLRAMMPTMRVTALRHSPLGFGLLTNAPDPALTAAWLAPTMEDAAIRDDLAAFCRAVDPAQLYAVTNRMSAVQLPVTLVWGLADGAFSPALGLRLRDRFADAEWRPVEGARTFVSLDAPDAVAAAVPSRG